MQSMARPYIQLTIRRKGESNLIALDTGGPMVHESEIQVEEKRLRGLVGQITRLATPRERPGASESQRGEPLRHENNDTILRLQFIGEQIFSQLLPEQTRMLLRDAAPANLFLHMDEPLIPVPWELCHDGVDFLATRFQMGRYVRVPRPIPFSTWEPVEPGRLKILLITDPTESLPQAAQEAEQLCQILDGVAKVKVTLIGGKLVSSTELQTELQAHDVVHFAGHSHYDPIHPNRSGWRLYEGVLTAEELRTLSRPPLLVFSNSCQAGTTTAWGGRYQYDGEAFGIGSAFLAAGVRNYIGTFWVVHDEESRDFAVAFYTGLAAGLGLGEALRQARLEIRSQKGGERLTWASYMLYGDPAVTPFPAEAPSSPPPQVGGERKLVVIFSADVKGYSRLIGLDDLATVQTLIAYREVMTNFIQKYRGEVVDSPGDNLLALFPSVVGAVQCAVDIQRELKTRNATLPDDRRMEFRIGINLGDILVRGGSVYGDGVNVAARLEGLAEPGGICISGIVYEQARNKPELTLSYEALGEQNLKNIAQPVLVYRVLLAPSFSSALEKKVEEARPKRWRRTVSARLFVLVGGLALVILAVVIFQQKTRDSRGFGPKAIVVRPPTVLKAGPQHDWMPAAMSVYLSSQLSRVPDLKVYPEEHFNFLVQQSHSSELQVAKQLKITKMIRASFLAEGNRLRIEVHIEDVENVVHEPSEEVQGKQEDFFNLIQDIATKITARLNLKPMEQSGGSTPPSAPSLDTFKLMLEGEGETSTTLPQSQVLPSQGAHPQEAEPQSWFPLLRSWPAVSAAWADDSAPQGNTPEAEVRQVLEKYRLAYEKKDLTMLEDVYATLTPAQREANEKYFHQTQDLSVRLKDVEVAVHGSEAVASYTREDHFVDAQTGQKVNLDARFTKIFVRTGEGWRMTVGKK